MKKVLAPLLLAALAVGIPTPTASAAAPDVTIYMAPAGSCSDSRTGATPAQALCTPAAVSNKLNKMFSPGADFANRVYIRLVTGKGTYGISRGSATFSFAPPRGTTVYIVPDWFSVSNPDVVNKARNPVFAGSSTNWSHPFNITTTVKARDGKNLFVNRGGRYYVGNLTVQRFNNGIGINMGSFLEDDVLDPVSTKWTRSTYLKSKDSWLGEGRSASAPMKGAVIANSVFDKVGSEFTPVKSEKDPKTGKYTAVSFGVIRPWNTKGLVIKNSTFTDSLGDPGNTSHHHAVYGNDTIDLLVQNSSFKHNDGDAIRLRHGGRGFIRVMNSDFTRAGAYANVSSWHQIRAHELDKIKDWREGKNTTRFMVECKTEKVRNVGTSKTDGRTFDKIAKRPTIPIKADDLSGSSSLGAVQSRFCAEPGRIASPDLTVQYGGGKTFRLSWTPALPVWEQELTKRIPPESAVLRYHVYQAKLSDVLAAKPRAGREKNTWERVNGTKIATLPASRTDFTATVGTLDEEYFYYVVAESKGGMLSPRTDNMVLASAGEKESALKPVAATAAPKPPTAAPKPTTTAKPKVTTTTAKPTTTTRKPLFSWFGSLG